MLLKLLSQSSRSSSPSPHQNEGSCISNQRQGGCGLPGEFDEEEGRSSSQASSGAQRSAMGSQSGWLYQGSWVRSGRMAPARVSRLARDQRLQRL